MSRPTLEAVAARAGVSRATVSRVVNGGAGVRGSVADRVRAVVAELGYVPNPAARTLVTRRTGAVAVIIDEPGSRVFSDPFFSRQLRGIGRDLAARDTQLVLLLAEGPDDHARISRFLAGGHVDGVLAFSLHAGGPLPGMIARTGLPAVYGGRPHWSAPGPAPLYVDADNRAGARAAVRHLLGLGRRRIAHLAGPQDQTSAADRLAGYRDALPPGMPERVAPGDFTVEGGLAAMRRLLADRPGPAPDAGPDAVFAANDLMASGAIRALREHGRTVPGDVAVVGFDDTEGVATATDPPLTTVRQDVEGMGGHMARLLLDTLAAPAPASAQDAPPATPLITPTLLVRRASA
ncbi:LacI family DNA-binding transcriptional regulator [Streptomyces bambusae]|uniref:LacI family DNA-binding transcriptional regulator n=1 Tax=Streptomyces bambusae TaxID=1550616 RepID=A0ABS6Z922_9ACTN|nr:LacI family DNA-binding transcriptional regulator [Streptomyces bambusae]MBW5484242.1 LacI family DNA-binding transcriptional regulator [Streptomyces bambusae]